MLERKSQNKVQRRLSMLNLCRQVKRNPRSFVHACVMWVSKEFHKNNDRILPEWQIRLRTKLTLVVLFKYFKWYFKVLYVGGWRSPESGEVQSECVLLTWAGQVKDPWDGKAFPSSCVEVDSTMLIVHAEYPTIAFSNTTYHPTKYL